MNEHEIEPVWGLPEELPAGERILWQGVPSWRALMIRAFHVRKIAIYFSIMIAIRSMTLIADGETLTDIILSVLGLTGMASLAIALLALIAWATARATVYTITNRRIVLRVGVALPMMINLPFRLIESAGLAVGAGRIGDIALTLVPSERLAYLLLWPHARPWQLARPMPMLRCIEDAEGVATILSGALAATAAPTTVRISGPATDAADASYAGTQVAA